MNAGQSDQESQRLVSEAYRELTRESTPEHLDRTILRRASARGSAGLRFDIWMKPLAWTAVFALSLAFILEIAEFNAAPAPDSQPEGDTRSSNLPAKNVAAEKSAVASGESAPERSYGKGQPAVQSDDWEPAESIAAGCDAAARATPEDWVVCIEALRDKGAETQADREYEAYLLQYPPAD